VSIPAIGLVSWLLAQVYHPLVGTLSHSRLKGNFMADNEYESLKTRFKSYLNSNPGVFGLQADSIIAKFVEDESLCPDALHALLHDLVDEGFVCNDGRKLVASPVREVLLSKDHSMKVYAQKHFHINTLACPKKV